ncbi:alpha/beta fold hydrolase [Roseateles amylovorans]|uniref:Lysophospholipase n=1 Tax=Roseateles amylovorans TaxID=2978473 RepID=A0ABY6AS92_9BURK|nr:lysophospholipase [Roseateles amylovorans]UXH76096.1 lysophospholipase [Roseateles amylovorans]
MTSNLVKVSDGDIAVEQLGNRAAGSTASIVAVACDKFSALAKLSYPVDQMQLRGYGRSVVATKGNFRLTDYVSDIDTIAAQSKTPVVLFGYSHGGYFTAAHAVSRPGNIKALILIEPALFTDRADLLERAEKAAAGNQDQALERTVQFIEPTVGLRKDSVSHWVKAVAANINDTRSLADEFRVRAEHPITEEALARIDVPTLLIGGTHSQMAFMTKRAAQAIPYASVAWIQGATHLSLQEDAAAAPIAAVIDAFLNGLK